MHLRKMVKLAWVRILDNINLEINNDIYQLGTKDIMSAYMIKTTSETEYLGNRQMRKFGSQWLE